jgi:UDP-N-acetylenolpyruvoylglucosamine reductase
LALKPKQKQFVAVHSVNDLKTILQENKAQQKFILGGGSNMLLTKDIDALVIHIDLKGKRIIEETKILFGSKVRLAKVGMNLYCGLSIKILAV